MRRLLLYSQRSASIGLSALAFRAVALTKYESDLDSVQTSSISPPLRS